MDKEIELKYLLNDILEYTTSALCYLITKNKYFDEQTIINYLKDVPNIIEDIEKIFYELKEVYSNDQLQ